MPTRNIETPSRRRACPWPWLVLPVALVLSLSLLYARQQTVAPSPQIPVFKTTASEVLVHATVLNGKHETVDNLQQQAFSVFENGVAQHVDYFSHEDAPVSMGILIDNSGSMRDKRDAVVAAALNFVRSSNPDDEIFIVNFNDEYYLDADFTNNISKLQQGLDQIESRGGTALYDALIASLDHLAQYGKHDKKVLLIITDGEDDASRYTLEETTRIAHAENGPMIYCVGLLAGDERSERNKAERALTALATATGGEAYFPKDLSQVNTITKEVAIDVRAQYTLSYRSNQTGAGFRTIRVEVHAPKVHGLTVRTRDGYYEPPAGGGGQ